MDEIHIQKIINGGRTRGFQEQGGKEQRTRGFGEQGNKGTGTRDSEFRIGNCELGIANSEYQYVFLQSSRDKI